MAAVRMEDTVLKSWRYRALAQRFGLSKRWAWGLMFEVYSECTEANSETLAAAALDVMGVEDGIDGLAAAIVACELGELTEDGQVRIRGCRDEHGRSRIGWLRERREAGRRGGQSRASKQTPSKPEANAKQTQPSGSGSGSGSGSFSERERERRSGSGGSERALRAPLSLSLDEGEGMSDGPGPAPASPEPKRGTASHAIAVDSELAKRQATVFLDFFRRRIKDRFSQPVNDYNVRDVQTLLTRGYTQGDMRLVARHQKAKYSDDERMRQHIVPSSILKPARFAERLADAKAEHPSWADEHQRDDAEASTRGGVDAWEQWAADARLRTVP